MTNHMERHIAEEDKIICPYCKSVCDRNWNFCNKCGHPLKVGAVRSDPAVYESLYVRCECGKLCDRSRNFCSRCGRQLKDQIVVVQYNPPEESES